MKYRNRRDLADKYEVLLANWQRLGVAVDVNSLAAGQGAAVHVNFDGTGRNVEVAFFVLMPFDACDISSLGERIAPNLEEEHTFKNRVKGVTVAYHRDRGEPMTAALRHENIHALKKSDWSIDWFYLFDAKKGEWLPPVSG